jgi:hypothetical protein
MGTIGLLSWPRHTILGRSSAQISNPTGAGMTADGVQGGKSVDASRATLVMSRVTQYSLAARKCSACRRSMSASVCKPRRGGRDRSCRAMAGSVFAT